MADLIQIKGGKGVAPTLKDRELAYNKDEEALYIGTGSGNIRLCGARDIEDIIERLNAITARLDALENPIE